MKMLQKIREAIRGDQSAAALTDMLHALDAECSRDEDTIRQLKDHRAARLKDGADDGEIDGLDDQIKALARNMERLTANRPDLESKLAAARQKESAAAWAAEQVADQSEGDSLAADVRRLFGDPLAEQVETLRRVAVFIEKVRSKKRRADQGGRHYGVTIPPEMAVTAPGIGDGYRLLPEAVTLVDVGGLLAHAWPEARRPKFTSVRDVRSPAKGGRAA